MKLKFSSFFADDIFISYSRKDANTYAVGLANELTKKGFTCFFDKLGTDSNKNLPPSLIKRIRQCGMLVLVGSAGAYTSKFVGTEIGEFIAANGSIKIVPIDLGGKMEGATWYSQVVGIAEEVEPAAALLSGNPSPAVVNRIVKSFTYLRSKERLRRYTIAAAITLFILSGASVTAGFFAKQKFAQAQTASKEANQSRQEARYAERNAEEQKRRAQDAGSKADSATHKALREAQRAQLAEADAKAAINKALRATAEADRQRQLADEESRRAEQERIKARQEAENARVGRLVSTAQGLTGEDPTAASLILAEADPADEPANGVIAARELLSRFVTKFTFKADVHVNSDSGVNSVEYSPDGSQIVTSGKDGSIRVWENNFTNKSIVLQGEPGISTSAAFRSDGQYILSSSSGGSSRLWSTHDQAHPLILKGKNAAFSPDGKHILTLSDNTIFVYKGDGSAEATLPNPASYFSCAAFSRNSRLIGAATGDGAVYVWNLDKPNKPVVMHGHQNTVFDVDFSFDDKFIASVSQDNTARIWRIDSAGLPPLLLDHRRYGQPQIVKFSPDGKTVATGTLGQRNEGYVVLWSLSGQGQPVEIQGTGTFHGPPRSVVFSKDGRRVLIAWLDGRAELWNTDGSGPLAVLRGHQQTVYSAVFSPNEREIATASQDNTVKIWTKLNRDEPVVVKGGYSNAGFSPDGKRIVVPTPAGTTVNENTAVIMNSDGSGDNVILRGHKEPVQQATFSPDGSKILTASFDGTARIWPINGSDSAKVFDTHSGPVGIAAFSPDGSTVVTVNNFDKGGEYPTKADGVIRLWEANGNKDPIVMKGHIGEIYKIRFTDDGKSLLSAGADGTVRVWSANGAADPVILHSHRYEAVDADFDNTGKRIVSVSEDKQAIIENVDGTGKPDIWNLGKELISCEFSPDGKLVVLVAKNDKGVYLWNVGDDKKNVLSGHTKAVNSARFSRDGKYIVTTSYDGTALVWRTEGTGEPVSLQNQMQDNFFQAEFSPDNKRILTVSSASGAFNPFIQIWTVDWSELVGLLRSRTGECLTVPQRIKYLHEDEQQAGKHFLECQSRLGRMPTVQ